MSENGVSPPARAFSGISLASGKYESREENWQLSLEIISFFSAPPRASGTGGPNPEEYIFRMALKNICKIIAHERHMGVGCGLRTVHTF